jgi:hypothetical protein
MTNNNDLKIAEALGLRVLQWKGSEFLELIYFLEEKNSLNILRLFASLSRDSQNALLEFMELVSNQDDIELRADHSGLHIDRK